MNISFIASQKLNVGITWFDAGTPVVLLECSEFVSAVEAEHPKKSLLLKK